MRKHIKLVAWILLATFAGWAAGSKYGVPQPPKIAMVNFAVSNYLMSGILRLPVPMSTQLSKYDVMCLQYDSVTTTLDTIKIVGAPNASAWSSVVTTHKTK